MKAQWGILSFSCLEGIVKIVFMAATWSPFSNPHKSSVLGPPPVLSPLESCQTVLYKIDTVLSKTFQEVRDYIYYSGKIYESQNSRLAQSIDKCALISSFDSYLLLVYSELFCNSQITLHLNFFFICPASTSLLVSCMSVCALYYSPFFSMMISPFYAPHSQVSPAPLSTTVQSSRSLSQVQRYSFLQSSWSPSHKRFLIETNLT